MREGRGVSRFLTRLTSVGSGAGKGRCRALCPIVEAARNGGCCSVAKVSQERGNCGKAVSHLLSGVASAELSTISGGEAAGDDRGGFRLSR